MFVAFTALVFFALAQSSGSSFNQYDDEIEDNERPPFICRIECTEMDS